MKKRIILVALMGMSQAVFGQSIKDLDFLIGKWEVSEVVYPGTDKEYIETGTRQCSYILDETYIQCTTKGVRHGKARVYQSNINYNKNGKRFEMNTVFSDYDFKGAYEMHLNLQTSVLHIIPGYEPGEGELYRSRINFKNKDQLIWEGWSSEFNEAPGWVKLYTETARRVK